MANQIFNEEWKRKIGSPITDTRCNDRFPFSMVISILGQINNRRHDFDSYDESSYDALTTVFESFANFKFRILGKKIGFRL